MKKKISFVTLTALQAKPLIEFCIKLADVISHFEKPLDNQVLEGELLQSSSPNGI
jgi:hypothetical protein